MTLTIEAREVAGGCFRLRIAASERSLIGPRLRPIATRRDRSAPQVLHRLLPWQASVPTRRGADMPADRLASFGGELVDGLDLVVGANRAALGDVCA
jgi:hypothetical protein